jgi:hypothetical protein
LSLRPLRHPAARPLILLERRPLDALDLFWHLANFVLPAVGVGALSAALCKLLWRRGLARVSWFTLAWQAAAAGLAVLVAGLVITGHDGRMITWAGLVVACAVVPWLKSAR